MQSDETITNESIYLSNLRSKWAVALALKILFCVLSLEVLLGSSFFSVLLIWDFSLLVRFAIIGFACPLLVMIWYLRYSYDQVKACPSVKTIAGDSAYFLGFLFTIASIIAAMADIALTDMRDETMTYVASRFALAMVTTLLGMAYRTWLTGFDRRKTKKDASDGQNKSGNEDPVQVVVRAILGGDSDFDKLKNAMNQSIVEFERVVTNATAAHTKIEASLQILLKEAGENLNKSVNKIIEDAAKKTCETAVKANEMLVADYSERQRNLSEAIAISTSQLKEQIEAIHADFKSWDEETKGIHTKVKNRSVSLEKSLGGLAGSIETLGGTVGGTQKNIHSELAIVEENTKKIGEFSTLLEQGIETHNKMRADFEKIMSVWNTAEAKCQGMQLNLQDGFKKTADALQDLPVIARNLRQASMDFKESIDNLNRNLANANMTITEMDEKAKRLAESKRRGFFSRLFRKS